MASSTGIILYMSQCGIIATQVHFLGNGSSLKVATMQLAPSRPESPIPGIYYTVEQRILCSHCALYIEIILP